MKKGIEIESGKNEKVKLNLNSSHTLEITVDDLAYAATKISKKTSNENDPSRSTKVASIIFGVLGGFNVIFSFLALLFTLDSSLQYGVIGIVYTIGALACSIIYIASAVYLRRGVYKAYFVGAVTFFATTIYVSSIEPDHDGEFTLWFVLPRWLLLALLLRYFNRVLQLAQSDQEIEEKENLDSEL